MSTSLNRSGVVRWALPSLLAVLGVGVASHLSGASPVMVMAPQPTSIATVNLVKLMEGLTKASYLNAQHIRKIENRQKTIDEVKDKIAQLKAEIDLLPKTSRKEIIEKSAQLYELEQMRNARFQALDRIVNLEKGELVRELYDDVQKAATAYAQKNGYDYVIVDDRAMELPEQATQDQMNMVIQSKRILFAADTLDITSALMQEMNNQFQAPVAPTAAEQPK